MPPLEPGEVLVVRGRVRGFDSKKRLAGATLDIWQANAAGRYDNDDPRIPPRTGVFHNRARLVTDDTGYYEFETIKPGRYKIGPTQWRPAHIHSMVAMPGYTTLVTQLYSEGDPENERDSFIKPSLIIAPETVTVRQGRFLLGTFDIVLAGKWWRSGMATGTADRHRPEAHCRRLSIVSPAVTATGTTFCVA